MHNDGSLAKYLAKNSPGSPLSDPTGFGKYLPGYKATEPQAANRRVSGKATGSLARYLGDG